MLITPPYFKNIIINQVLVWIQILTWDIEREKLLDCIQHKGSINGWHFCRQKRGTQRRTPSLKGSIVCSQNNHWKQTNILLLLIEWSHSIKNNYSIYFKVKQNSCWKTSWGNRISCSLQDGRRTCGLKFVLGYRSQKLWLLAMLTGAEGNWSPTTNGKLHISHLCYITTAAAITKILPLEQSLRASPYPLNLKFKTISSKLFIQELLD